VDFIPKGHRFFYYNHFITKMQNILLGKIIKGKGFVAIIMEKLHRFSCFLEGTCHL